jgi:hypothetical protein
LPTTYRWNKGSTKGLKTSTGWGKPFSIKKMMKGTDFVIDNVYAESFNIQYHFQTWDCCYTIMKIKRVFIFLKIRVMIVRASSLMDFGWCLLYWTFFTPNTQLFGVLILTISWVCWDSSNMSYSTWNSIFCLFFNRNHLHECPRSSRRNKGNIK